MSLIQLCPPTAPLGASLPAPPFTIRRRFFLRSSAAVGSAFAARFASIAPAATELTTVTKATRDALAQAQVVENKMMARVLRGSSQDVQLLVRHPGLWERWLGKLRKRGFFDGVDEGSPEFDERVRKALRAFARRPGVREFDSG